MTTMTMGTYHPPGPGAFRAFFRGRRLMAVALLVVATICTVLVSGYAHADDLPNGLTLTPVGEIKDKTPDGQCRAGSITEISGPADLVRGITDSLTVAESHLPSALITSHEMVDGKLRVTAYERMPCTTDPGGALVWLRPAVADIVATAAYVAITAGIMAFGYLKFGLPIVDPRLEALAGCLSGGVWLALNNAIIGLTDWRELLSGSITGCVNGTALNLTLMRSTYWVINAINWVRGAPLITYAMALGDVQEVGEFTARTVAQTLAQSRVPDPR
jgi:hypothetical protein